MAQWLFPPCNFGFKITLRWFSDYKIEGLENIPEVRPLLIASNHLSNLDPAIIAAALPEAPVFLAKKELFKFSAGSFLLRGYGAYPVDRRGADIRALKWITDQLVSAHRIVMMFPEGTRSKTGGLLKGQPGLAHLAITTGATIVPIALSGSENLQNPMKVFKPTAILRLKIGRPFVAKDASLRPTREMASKVTKEIMIRIAQLLPEDQRGAYSNLIDIKPTQTVMI
tara:strand:+ start:252 stop:929 length:678 start_codon:yes stop_codon:yes gene_type:complete